MNLLIPKFIKYQLYLLQLENYKLGRYFKLLFKKGLWPKGEQRKSLVWTAKARALLLMAVGLHILASVVAILWIPAFAGMTIKIILWFLIFFVLLTTYYLLLTTALLLLWPFDFIVKKIIVWRAKTKIKKLSSVVIPAQAGIQSIRIGQKIDAGSGSGMTQGGLKIIGIAGSYGKTTMKEVLKSVLSAKCLVLSTPESVNTPVGIARFILNKVDEKTEVLILELGEHYKGDIKELCNIARPDISIITGINEAHLERMGSLENITATIFEAVEFAKKDALIVLNGDDKNVVSNYQKFVKQGQKVLKFQNAEFRMQNFNIDRLCWEAEAEGLGKIEINLLGEYALGDAEATIIVAKHLGLNNQEIKIGLSQVRPVEHRLQPIVSAGDILVIDDSYNGNSDGAREAINVLARFSNRRRIYITPGLVETGSAALEIHREIGRQLAAVADVVVLIKNSATGYVEKGIKNVVIARSPAEGGATKQSNKNQEIAAPSDALGLAMTKIIWFNTAQEAHEGLKNIIKPGDVVLFQNDWGDQYT